jgi:hypothetical protein
VVCLFTIFLSLVTKRFNYAIALLLIMALDYFSLFFTIDGLRIHYTVVSAVYPFLLLMLICQANDLFNSLKHAKNIKQ